MSFIIVKNTWHIRSNSNAVPKLERLDPDFNHQNKALICKGRQHDVREGTDSRTVQRFTEDQVY
jgi:hypothetical protein